MWGELWLLRGCEENCDCWWLLRIITLVLLRVHASTQAAAGTCTHLQVTALKFSSVRKLRTFGTVRKLSACPERHCNMCLTSSLHAHAFPKMLLIPALDHSKPLRQIRLLRFSSVCACVAWFEVRNVRRRMVWIPQLQNFAAIFLV